MDDMGWVNHVQTNTDRHGWDVRRGARERATKAILMPGKVAAWDEALR
jgi:hypothetical protein